MKTKIKIIITVCAFVAVLNASATANYEVKNSGLISVEESVSALNEKIVSFESEINGNIDYQKEAQMVIQWIADKEESEAFKYVMNRGFIAPVETINSSENEVIDENVNETTDFINEARLMTKFIADQEEAKVVRNMNERGFVAPVETINSSENEVVNGNDEVIVDFEKEARLMTKFIADQEEAKVVRNMNERGFVAPVETINSSENEVVNGNDEVIVDFEKEARLMTKFIADQEEAKVVRNVKERGFVAPVETINSAENEVVNGNDEVLVDFEKEAQLLIKLIADKEEAKVVQKFIAEGKL
jgi:SOS response regulatory protein OraA/RecX